MQEQWSRWEPIQGLAKKYDLDLLEDSDKCFRIMLSDEDSKSRVLVVFEHWTEAYRNADETYRYKLICDLVEKYGEHFHGWTFFEVDNSDYVKWLFEQSYGLAEGRNLKHFSFICSNHVIDVIAFSAPTVELIPYQTDEVPTSEQWVKWEPIERLEQKYSLGSIEEREEELNIVLLHRETNAKAKVSFANSVDSYRRGNMQCKDKLLYTLNNKYGGASYNWAFFKVNNSQYVYWLFHNSTDRMNDHKWKHFSFILTGCVLDVVAQYEPKVEIISK
ncbi:MAG: hypothetical protein WCE21_00755 [Candidatus Babeliales bacterium]